MQAWILTVIFAAVVFGNNDLEEVEGKQNLLNFVIFDEGESDAISRLLAVVANELKGSKDGIGKAHRIHINNSTNWTHLINVEWVELLKSERRPSFALDFSACDVTGHMIKSLVRKYALPTISTKTQSARHLVTMLPGWTKLEDNLNEFLVQVRAPETIYDLAGLHIMFQSGTFNAASLSRNVFKRNAYVRRGNAMSGITLEVAQIQNYTHVPEFLAALSVHMFFITGSPSKISRVLDGVAHSSRNMFSDRNSLWTFSTEINGKIQIPKEARQIMALYPEIKFSGFEKKMKTAKTKNMTELFYLDMILGTVRAVGRMKREKLWELPDLAHPEKVKVDLRSHFTAELQKEGNFLGKYIAISNTTLQPDVWAFKMELITRNETRFVGTLKFSSDLKRLTSEIKDIPLWNSHLPVEYLNAVVVVDPPFVIKNDSCVGNKSPAEESVKCYSGYVIDIVKQFQKEMPRLKIVFRAEDVYGSMNKNSDWDGAIGVLSKNKTDLGFGIGAFSVNLTRPVLFSEPFYDFQSKNDNITYAFAFGKDQVGLNARTSQIIKKLMYQRYLEQLKEIWFHEHEEYKSYKFQAH